MLFKVDMDQKDITGDFQVPPTQVEARISCKALKGKEAGITDKRITSLQACQWMN